MVVEEIRINEIERADKNDELRLRDGVNDDAIERYMMLYENGTQKPILLAKIRERRYVLIDGFHRLQAVKKLKWEKISANVEEIPEEEWLGKAIEANNDATRGVILTKDERNKAIGKLLEASRGQQYIAERFGLKQPRIAQIINDDKTLKTLAINKTKVTSVNEWLAGKKQAAIAKDYNITEGRVSQIISEFKDGLEKQYEEGTPISLIVGEVRGQKIDLSEEKCRELLKIKDNELNRVIEGDCIKEIPKLPDNSIDMILTDPPYGIDYQSNFKKEKDDKINGDSETAPVLIGKMLKAIEPKLKKDAFIYCFASWKTYPVVAEQIEKYFKIKNILVWIKNEPSLGDLNSYSDIHEFIIFGVRGNKKLNIPQGSTRPTNIFNAGSKYRRVAGEASGGHPTAKPIDLCADFVLYGSEPGDIVIDPFCGSGASLAAAKQQKRKWIGIEIEPKYYEIAKNKVIE